MNWRFCAAVAGVFATALPACTPGYMKASELESKHQGPSDCEARCAELGMRMGALVLVSDTLPGCVCQPKPPPPPAALPAPGQVPPPAPPPSSDQTPTSDASQQGASAATAGYAVIAAAARGNQTQQQRQTQQSYFPK
ncbi:MAG TPA: hypothetical protein VER12_15545 [Polyangiaceae bacterium]|nr:hypothetical protein [Polyangiaceae bacterium]